MTITKCITRLRYKRIKMKYTPHINALLVTVLATLLIGCAQAKPFEYRSDTEIKEGPGLFSGEKGAFTVYSSKKRADTSQKADEEGQAAPKTFEDPEFVEFQQWRKERDEFKAFQEWKRSRRDTAEYEEFREWQRFQNFKKWQESQSDNR
jgi:hypothetical protein